MEEEGGSLYYAYARANQDFKGGGRKVGAPSVSITMGRIVYVCPKAVYSDTVLAAVLSGRSINTQRRT